MENINGIMVDIHGVRFPAVNIQIGEEYPKINNDLGVAYGIYFEIMFENGVNVQVYQEVAAITNGLMSSECSKDDIEHFIIEVTRMQDEYQTILHAYHAKDERQLLFYLQGEKGINSRPVEGAVA